MQIRHSLSSTPGTCSPGGGLSNQTTNFTPFIHLPAIGYIIECEGKPESEIL